MLIQETDPEAVLLAEAVLENQAVAHRIGAVPEHREETVFLSESLEAR